MHSLIDPRALITPLTVSQAAESLQMTTGYLYSLIREGKLRAYRRKRPGRPPELRVPVWAVMLWQDEELMTAIWGLLRPPFADNPLSHADSASPHADKALDVTPKQQLSQE